MSPESSPLNNEDSYVDMSDEAEAERYLSLNGHQILVEDPDELDFPTAESGDESGGPTFDRPTAR